MLKSLGYSDSTVKRYRNDIKMASPYRIDGLKRPRLTSIEPSKISESVPETTARPQNNNTKTKRKSKNIQVAGLSMLNLRLLMRNIWIVLLINRI